MSKGAKIRQFTLTFSRTVNLGHYESARVEASVVVDVDESEDLSTQADYAQFELRSLLEETWKAQSRAKEKDRELARGNAGQ